MNNCFIFYPRERRNSEIVLFDSSAHARHSVNLSYSKTDKKVAFSPQTFSQENTTTVSVDGEVIGKIVRTPIYEEVTHL